MTAGTITIIQGEDFTLNLAFTHGDGSAYDLTGCSVGLKVRRNHDSLPVVDKQATFTSAAVGLAAIPLAGPDTDIEIRAWQYQVTLVDSTGQDRPSGTYPFVVTSTGSTTDSVAVIIGSNSIGVTLTLAGPAGVGITSGGTTGQVLTKHSNADYDTSWSTPVSATADQTFSGDNVFAGAVTFSEPPVFGPEGFKITNTQGTTYHYTAGIDSEHGALRTVTSTAYIRSARSSTTVRRGSGMSRNSRTGSDASPLNRLSSRTVRSAVMSPASTRASSDFSKGTSTRKAASAASESDAVSWLPRRRA